MTVSVVDIWSDTSCILLICRALLFVVWCASLIPTSSVLHTVQFWDVLTLLIGGLQCLLNKEITKQQALQLCFNRQHKTWFSLQSRLSSVYVHFNTGKHTCWQDKHSTRTTTEIASLHSWTSAATISQIDRNRA